MTDDRVTTPLVVGALVEELRGAARLVDMLRRLNDRHYFLGALMLPIALLADYDETEEGRIDRERAARGDGADFYPEMRGPMLEAARRWHRLARFIAAEVPARKDVPLLDLREIVRAHPLGSTPQGFATGHVSLTGPEAKAIIATLEQSLEDPASGTILLTTFPSTGSHRWVWLRAVGKARPDLGTTIGPDDPVGAAGGFLHFDPSSTSPAECWIPAKVTERWGPAR